MCQTDLDRNEAFEEVIKDLKDLKPTFEANADQVSEDMLKGTLLALNKAIDIVSSKIKG